MAELYQLVLFFPDEPLSHSVHLFRGTVCSFGMSYDKHQTKRPLLTITATRKIPSK